tara:strand:+ start:1031 stop:2002 length:972 start_codon:yes stop_codon:yes gene_type:complete
MKRRIKSLTEQMSESRSNYDRILGKTGSSNKIILSEQWTGSTPTNAGGFRVCKCSQVDANGTCDTWGLNHMGNADYHFTQWNSFWQFDGQAPQVGDIINAYGVDRYVDRVNPTPDTNCYGGNGTIGVPCTTPNYYNGQPAYTIPGTGALTIPTNPNPACPGFSTTASTSGDWWCDPTGAFIDPNTGNSCTESTTQPQSYFTGPYSAMTDCLAQCMSATTCDTSTASPCAVQWWQNPNASWASTWITNRDCSNYNWPSIQLETQALALMASAPNPQPGPYNNWSDIWGSANAAWPNTTGPPKNTFIGKMAKAKYSQCQMAACNC